MPIHSSSPRPRLLVALSAGSTLAATSAALMAAPAPKVPAAKPAARKPVPAASAATTPAPSREAVEFFEKNVRPVLVEQCQPCHSGKGGNPGGGLRVDGRAFLVKGGERGAAVVPGKPEESLLVRAIHYTERGLTMPPKGKLPEAQIAALTEWVKMGAPWPGRDAKPAAAASGPQVTAFDLKARAKHWSFQPLRPTAPLAVKNSAWVRTPIDRFLLAALEAKGLSPAPAADRRTLLRRVTQDLTGLPPTPSEIDAFLADKSPTAYEKVVERLLASPRYGERWARHWLDLVRYAETDGHEFDFEKPNAWEYRDYVIRALNDDVPYNRFVQEHIAGDLLARPRLRRDTMDTPVNESLLGTGFYWLGEGKHSPVDLLEDESERVENQIDVFGKTFLGLTVQCARCHDHKFDAISTRDFYAISGYMKSARYAVSDANLPGPSRRLSRELDGVDARLGPALIQALAQSKGSKTALIPSRPLLAANGPVALPPTTANAESELQKRWNSYLREEATNAGHPLYRWYRLLTVNPPANPNGAPPPPFEVTEENRQRQREKQPAAAPDGAPAAAVSYAEFSGETFADWFVSGEAFGTGPVRTLAPCLAEGEPRGSEVSRLLQAGTADSGRYAERMEGTLRSPQFKLEKRYVLFRASGKSGRINLILDGFQRIRYPIYGGLTLEINGETPTWYVMDVGKWQGHRAYAELSDPGAGYLAVDRVLFSDQSPVPPVSNPLTKKLAEGLKPSATPTAEPEVLSTLARRSRELVTETAGMWASGTLETAADRDARIELTNQLLAAGLVPVTTDAQTAAIGCDVSLPTAMESLRTKRAELAGKIPAPLMVMAAADGTGYDDRVHLRGSVKTLGETVPRRFLEAIAGKNQPSAGPLTGRLALAEKMVAPTNPLLPRVFVNRVWMHHFGEGIVRTPDDFGIRGERPTNPSLLEYLATDFVKNGWSLKRLHRQMVLSNTYRMSSRAVGPAGAKAEAADPQNRLLHRMPVQRLEAEAVRDAILAVSGRLDTQMYGPGVLPYLTPFLEGRGRPGQSGSLDGNGRRSVYQGVRRNFLSPLFLAFDYPIPFSTMGKRSVSTVPAQALTLMNNPFVVEQAGVWAKRVLAQPEQTSRQRIGGMYLSAYGRPPTEAEATQALAFLAEQDKQYGGSGNASNDLRAWTDLCHVLLNVKEFLFVE